MSMSSVITVPLGLSAGPVVLPFVNAYLAHCGDDWVVVDTGPPGNAPRILSVLRRNGIREEAVRLIFLTHGHFDHFGSALELRRLLPGHPRIAMHPADRPFVADACWPSSLRPSTLSGAFGLAGGAIGMCLYALAGTLHPWPESALDEVLWLDDVPLSDTPTDLMPVCRVEARAIRTPGHSPGSITLQLSTGEAIVGDILASGIRRTDARPNGLVDDAAQVASSLRSIAALRPTIVYPGHGGPFLGADVARLADGADQQNIRSPD